MIPCQTKIRQSYLTFFSFLSVDLLCLASSQILLFWIKSFHSTLIVEIILHCVFIRIEVFNARADCSVESLRKLIREDLTKVKGDSHILALTWHIIPYERLHQCWVKITLFSLMEKKLWWLFVRIQKMKNFLCRNDVRRSIQSSASVADAKYAS